jgi:hypothetical protein
LKTPREKGIKNGTTIQIRKERLGSGTRRRHKSLKLVRMADMTAVTLVAFDVQ